MGCSLKNLFLIVDTLGVCGGPEKTDFYFNSFYFGWVWCSIKNSFLTVSTLGRFGGPEKTDF